MKKLKVYIAGPYSKGDQALNVKKAMDMAEECLRYEMVPFVPHLTHFQHMQHPRDYEEWLAYDIEWLKVCDCLLRIPGESSGADKEVEVAELLDIPVFTNMYHLIEFKNGTRSWKLYETDDNFLWNRR